MVTDQGIESSICDSKDVVDMFFAWLDGKEQSIPGDGFLFPNAVYVPGWNHLWSGTICDACTKLSGWASFLGR